MSPLQLLSNGAYHVVLMPSGGGRSVWNGLAITRWREDAALGSGTCLRTRPAAIMLNGKDVAVERRSPLLALHRHFEIAQRVADIFLDPAPEELRVALDHIRRGLVAELFVDAVLDEFMVERVHFAQVQRVYQLTDEIGCPYQPRFRIGLGVVVVLGDRKSRQLDAARDLLLIDIGDGPQARADHDLPALHVIGHQEGVGRTPGRRDGVAGGIDHEAVFRVPGADAAHIADVMVQRRQDRVSPLDRRYNPLEAPPA